MAIKILTDQNFEQEVVNATKPVMVDFWAPWCGPCQMMGPIIEELAQEMGDKVIIGKLNVDENPITAQKYGVMSIPTLIIFKGGIIIDQIIGIQPKKIIKDKLENLIQDN